MAAPGDPSLGKIVYPTLDAYPQPRHQTREAWFRSIVSGQARGVGPLLVRSVLALGELPYALAMRWRNWRCDVDPRRVTRVDVPVVSVGNLTLGGTGKTPVVEWVARWFRQHDTRVTIVSRGYGGQHGARNDEALELEERLDDVPHLQNPNRVEVAQLAIEEFECELVLLDDGFQHRRLGRDLDIVLVDALDPFGCN
ncbi:MAG: tetraacyldisaccharide 4'-kinase, partial [Planctomycetaceae bacterium]|nr:tetraacyldisaccharide 4'-kinase [Planctomycetaceae bacterium]